MHKFPHLDDIRLGQQRPRVSGRLWVAIFWGLVIQAFLAAITLLILYVGYLLFVR